jgi:hypothetical protein
MQVCGGSKYSLINLARNFYCSQIAGELERFQFRPGVDSHREMVCQKHELELKYDVCASYIASLNLSRYFDVTCNLCICAECAMFTEEHRLHKFDKRTSRSNA